MILGLLGRLVYLMIFDAEYYQEKAKALHEREREIKAARGEIVDRNGNPVWLTGCYEQNGVHDFGYSQPDQGTRESH